jgi:hypothetical protein
MSLDPKLHGLALPDATPLDGMGSILSVDLMVCVYHLLAEYVPECYRLSGSYNFFFLLLFPCVSPPLTLTYPFSSLQSLL